MTDSSMTTRDVVEAIERERSRLLRSLDALGERAETVSVTEEGWTAKDTLAHLIHWATQVAFALGAEVEPPVYMVAERMRRKAAGLPDTMPTGDESNALAVAHYHDVPIEDVRPEFEQLADTIVERARQRSDDEMHATGVVPWAPSLPLWRLIAGDTFAHWPLHSEMIERAAAN